MAGATPGRREQQKAAREQRILRAAEELFARRGYAGATMEGVARRARLAVGTIYNYFPSKPEIVLALLRRETADTLAAGQALVDEPAPDACQAVAALWASQAAIYQRYGYAAASQMLRYQIDTVDLQLLKAPPDHLSVSREPVGSAFDALKDCYRQYVAVPKPT